MQDTSISIYTATEGETIEQKLERVINNKEPISDGAERIYTERKDGVQAQYDIRTDRFEIAVEAMDKVDKSNKAKREERHKAPKEEHKTEEKGGETPDSSGTSKVPE